MRAPTCQEMTKQKNKRKPRRKSMRKLEIAKWVGTVLLGLLAIGSMAAGPASVAGMSSVSAQSTSSGPRTWHVLIGGQSQDQALQAEGYYPRVITIDAGDTVVWTLNTGEIHSVTFMGTCEESSCVPPCVNIDISPCGSPTYDGVSALASSGRMVPAGYITLSPMEVPPTHSPSRMPASTS